MAYKCQTTPMSLCLQAHLTSGLQAARDLQFLQSTRKFLAALVITIRREQRQSERLLLNSSPSPNRRPSASPVDYSPVPPPPPARWCPSPPLAGGPRCLREADGLAVPLPERAPICRHA